MLCETQNSVFHIEKNIRFPCSLYYKKLKSHMIIKKKEVEES